MRENFGLELQNGPSLTYMLDLIAMQMSRVNHKKGSMTFFVEWMVFYKYFLDILSVICKHDLIKNLQLM